MRRPLLIGLAVAAALGAAIAAQAPGAAPGAPAGPVVGAGNFFSPIVANLERAVAFYRDGLGLEVAGPPSDASANPALRDMFGLPSARLRWTVARPGGSRTGVEIVEVAGAGGRLLKRRITDAGAMTLILSVNDDLDQVIVRARRNGGGVVNAPSGPGKTGARMAVMRDPDNHFVELIAAGPTAAPPPPRIRFSVQDLTRTLTLYRGRLGLRAAAAPVVPDWLPATVDRTAGPIRLAALEVPGSALTLELLQAGTRPRQTSGQIQDPGSTRLQLQVRDLDAAIRAVVGAGGRVVSSAGQPVAMPAGRGASIRAAIVQDPDNLFLVLIENAAPR